MNQAKSAETLYRSKIAGTGSYLPQKLLTNKDLEKMVDTNDEWITERTGISTRHIAAEGELTSDMALEASKIALKRAGLTPTDIEMILVATVSGDQVMPNTACVLQRKLGAKDCMALDISVACTGFVYGISIADQFIKTGHYKNILVVAAESLHHYVDYTDRNTCILFGDAAGACVLTRAQEDEDSKIYSSHLHADGSISDLFVLPAGGAAMPFSQAVLDDKLQYVRMNGREIFKHAVRTMSKACDEALDHNNMKADEVSWIIPHQANIRIIEAVAKHFGAPMEQVVVEIEHMGNTSAATIPVALDKAITDGRIKRGQNILLTAFGAGITSGSVLLRY